MVTLRSLPVSDTLYTPDGVGRRELHWSAVLTSGANSQFCLRYLVGHQHHPRANRKLHGERPSQMFWPFLGTCLELRGNCLDSQEIPSNSQQFILQIVLIALCHKLLYRSCGSATHNRDSFSALREGLVSSPNIANEYCTAKLIARIRRREIVEAGAFPFPALPFRAGFGARPGRRWAHDLESLVHHRLPIHERFERIFLFLPFPSSCHLRSFFHICTVLRFYLDQKPEIRAAARTRTARDDVSEPESESHSMYFHKGKPKGCRTWLYTCNSFKC